MNKKYILFPLLASAAAFTSCKDKTTTQNFSEETSETLTLKAGDTVKKAATPEERAAKLGFAARLPKNISAFSGIYDGREAFDKLLQSKVGLFAVERMANAGISVDDFTNDPEMAQTIAMYSEEYFTAYGPGAGDAAEQIVAFYEGFIRYGMTFGVYAADSISREGRDFNVRSLTEAFTPLSKGPFKGAPAEVLEIMGKFDIPAVYQGSKISDETLRAKVINEMEVNFTIFGSNPDVSEAITFEKGGAEFSGYRITGEKLVQTMNQNMSEDDLEEMKKIFDVKDLDTFKEILATKNFVVAVGVIDEYVMTFVGSSVEDFVLVDKVEDSICAHDELKSLDSYLGKDLLSVNFTDGDLNENFANLEVLGYRMITALTDGMKKGLDNAASLGDTEELRAILERISGQGKALGSFFKSSDQCSIVYIENGLKLEMYGGSNMPALDFQAKHSFTPLGNGADTVFFANWTSNQKYNSLVGEYVDTILEAGYMTVDHISDLGVGGQDFKEIQEGFKMFDEKGKNEALELWGALRGDLYEGLGAEGAIVIDLDGKLPVLPNVPEVVLEEGKIPRVAFVSKVKDRSKLQLAWSRTNTSLENILKTVGSMTGKEIPMQVPMSSKKGEFETWFIPTQFQSDDFTPSVSVSDDLFFASTSRLFPERLTEQLEKGVSGDKQGAWMHINFRALHQYAENTFTLVEKNADEIIPSEYGYEEFTANKLMIKDSLEAFRGIDSLTSHARQENGQTRISVHFKAE